MLSIQKIRHKLMPATSFPLPAPQKTRNQSQLQAQKIVVFWTLRPTTQKTIIGLFNRPTIAYNRSYGKTGARPQHPTQQTSIFAA